MTSPEQKLADIMARIEEASDETRHEFHEQLVDVIHELDAGGTPVGATVRELADELLAEATEVRFDNLPV